VNIHERILRGYDSPEKLIAEKVREAGGDPEAIESQLYYPTRSGRVLVVVARRLPPPETTEEDVRAAGDRLRRKVEAIEAIEAASEFVVVAASRRGTVSVLSEGAAGPLTEALREVVERGGEGGRP
jgi:hypothetical protein